MRQSTIAAAVRAAELTADDRQDTSLADRWVDAVHSTARALIHRLAAARNLDLDTGALPYNAVPAAEAALDEIGPLNDWTPLTIGDVHQEFLRLRPTVTPGGRITAVRTTGTTTRDVQGAWYTPQAIAQNMARLSLQLALDGLPTDDPDHVLRLQVVDPACGAGVLLSEGAQFVAREYARRLAGTDTAPPHLLRKVLPEVIHQCVFGMDIDPVAVDLTKTALWLQAGGAPPFGWLDRNVTCANPLAGPDSLPPRLRDGLGRPAATLAGATR